MTRGLCSDRRENHFKSWNTKGVILQYKAVKGFKDILPDKIETWSKIETEAKRLFGLFGYKEIRIPILERPELFARGIGRDTDIVSKEMYTFQDKADR